jgi:hypothetical protein
MTRTLLALALACAACSDGSSYIVVTVTSGTPLTLNSLDVTVTNAGMMAKTQVAPGAPFTIPPDATFALKFDKVRSGSVTVDVHAIGSNGQLASKSGIVDIAQGGTVSLLLELTPSKGDLGVLDLAQLDSGIDAAVEIDMAQQVDLVMADLSRRRTLSFAPAVSYQVGMQPGVVAVGDFNGDQKLDLAETNLTSKTLGVLLGNGDGTFGAPVYLNVGNAPWGLQIADFNGGAVDVAVEDIANASVSIFLGNGDGTFVSAGATATGLKYTDSGVAADFNGDKKVDLVVTARGSGVVAFLSGKGDGTFLAPATSTTNSAPYAVVARDYDGDGFLDIVVGSNDTSKVVTLLLGKGNGLFQAPANYAVGSDANAVGTADLDGDGILDVFSANYDDNNLSLLFGKGNTVFKPAQNLASGGGPSSVIAADLDHDGSLDLVSADAVDDKLSVFLASGAGTFAAPVRFSTGASPKSVAAEDFNGDGLLDLVVANYNSQSLGVLINTSK